MAANGISTLPQKRARQDAKLALASTKRQSTGRRYTINVDQLPTVYDPASNDTNDVIDNANAGGLITGRPWT
jgi:hypothetical protein